MGTQVLRWVLGATLGLLVGAFGACSDDYNCGERDLPGTQDCPCLPGNKCASDLVCEGGLCRLLGREESTTGTTSGSGSGTAGGSDTSTGGSDTSTGGSDTGTAGG